MPITVDDFIKELTKFRVATPGNGKAEVMLEFDNGIALEFAAAELSVATHEAGMHMERFLIFRPNHQGKKVQLRRGLML